MMRKSATADLRAAVSKDGNKRPLPWFETRRFATLLTMRPVFYSLFATR